MDISKFHKSLLGTDPTPEQRRLYDAFPKQRGFDSEDQNADRFIATFIAAMADTWDPDAKTSVHKVPLAIPRSIEPWCIDQINVVLEQVKVRKRKLPKSFNRQFVQAVHNVETGTRVFSITAAPKRWFAFGFSATSVAPEWIKEGLLGGS